MANAIEAVRQLSLQEICSFLVKYNENSAEELLDILNKQTDVKNHGEEAVFIAIARWQKLDPCFGGVFPILLDFSWPKYFEFEFGLTRSRTCFDPILISLMNGKAISIIETIPYCKIFKVLVRIAKEPQLSTLVGNFKLETTLVAEIVASKRAKMTTKINEMQYLQQKKLITPCESTYSAAFTCIETRQIHLLKYLLGVPGLAKYKRNGQNLLAYARFHFRSWWFKYFSKADIRRMILDASELDLGFGWRKLLRVSSVVLEVFKELIIKKELTKSNLSDALSPILGESTDRFIHQFDPMARTSLINLPKYAKKVSKARSPVVVPVPIGFVLKSIFPIDQLPVELLFLICEELTSSDTTSLCRVSKSFLRLGEDMLYRFVFKAEFPVIHQDLVSHGQPILLDRYTSLNRCRVNWRNGKFAVNYHKWNYGLDESLPTKMKAMDDNWAVACTDFHLLLWNCHDLQRRLIHNRSSATYSTVEILDSQPDRLPTLVQGSFYFMTLFIDGNRKQYSHKDVLGIEPKSHYYHSPIGRDKVITGYMPVIWSVELERIIGSVGCTAVTGAKYNPLTGMTVLSHTSLKMEYSFIDKNCQIVMEAPHQSFSSFFHRLHWISEHQFVHVAEKSSLFIDLRMTAQPYAIEQHLEKEPICPFYGSSLALAANSKRSFATVWDLSNRLWEKMIVLPDDVRDTPVCNSRYAVFPTADSSQLCVLDWQ